MHKLVGIVASPIFILIAFTGVYWNVSIILHEVLEHGFEPEHPPITQAYHAEHISFQQLLADSKAQIRGFNTTYLAIPNEPGMHISLFGEVPNSPVLISQYASMLTYDRNSGELMSSMDIRDANIWTKIDDSTRKLHFGYFAGLWSKVVWCIIGLSPLALALTGLYMYYFRRNPHKRKMQATNVKPA